MQKISVIHSPLFFLKQHCAFTAAAEAIATADVVGAAATTAEAAAGAKASTTSDFFSPNTALILPSASSKILTPDVEYAASVLTESLAAATA